jgi:hypothetical protein
MGSSAEYELKAENYAAAALVARDEEHRLQLIRLSAICRNKALKEKLGRQARILNRCPFTREQLRPF